jgi:hypothetical protein
MAPHFDESRDVPCQNAGSVSRAAEGIEGREQIPAVTIQSADPAIHHDQREIQGRRYPRRRFCWA